LRGRERREGGDGGVRHSDGYRNSGAGEGTQHVGVGVEKFDAVDGGLRFEEGGHRGGRWEVVCHRAIVDADFGGVGSVKLSEKGAC